MRVRIYMDDNVTGFFGSVPFIFTKTAVAAARKHWPIRRDIAHLMCRSTIRMYITFVCARTRIFLFTVVHTHTKRAVRFLSRDVFPSAPVATAAAPRTRSRHRSATTRSAVVSLTSPSFLRTCRRRLTRLTVTRGRVGIRWRDARAEFYRINDKNKIWRLRGPVRCAWMRACVSERWRARALEPRRVGGHVPRRIRHGLQ